MWLTLRWLIGERLQNPVICVSPWARHDDLLSDYRLKGEALTTASAAVCVCVCVSQRGLFIPSTTDSYMLRLG